MVTDQVVRGLRDRVRHSPASTTAVPGRLESAAWVLLHRAVPFDPAVQTVIARGWGLEVPPLHGEGPRTSAAAHTPATTGRITAGLHRLTALARAAPAPQVLTQALQLASARPDLPEPELRHALASAELSDGTAGAGLLRALAGLWPATTHGGQVLAPDDRQLPRVQHVAAAARQTGAVPHPCPPAAAALWLRENAEVVWAAGHLVTERDQRSVLGRLLRRQLAAVGRLDAPSLLIGAARAHPAARNLTATAVAAWSTAQPDLTWHGPLLELRSEQARWLQHTDRQVLAQIGDRGQTARPDLLRVLTGSGLTVRSASQWIVRCPWLRPTAQRGTYQPASPPRPLHPGPPAPPTRGDRSGWAAEAR